MWTLRDITHFTWAAKQLADVELMGLGYYQPDLGFNPEVKEFIFLSLPIPLSQASGIPSVYSGRCCKTFPLSLKPVPRLSCTLLYFDVNLPPLVCVILQGRLDDPWERGCELERAAGILTRRAVWVWGGSGTVPAACSELAWKPHPRIAGTPVSNRLEKVVGSGLLGSCHSLFS